MTQLDFIRGSPPEANLRWIDLWCVEPIAVLCHVCRPLWSSRARAGPGQGNDYHLATSVRWIASVAQPAIINVTFLPPGHESEKSRILRFIMHGHTHRNMYCVTPSPLVFVAAIPSTRILVYAARHHHARQTNTKQLLVSHRRVV